MQDLGYSDNSPQYEKAYKWAKSYNTTHEMGSWQGFEW